MKVTVVVNNIDFIKRLNEYFPHVDFNFLLFDLDNFRSTENIYRIDPDFAVFDLSATTLFFKDDVINHFTFPVFFAKNNFLTTQKNNNKLTNGFILEPINNKTDSLFAIIENRILSQKEIEYIAIIENHEKVKISCNTVLYIRSNDNYIEIFTQYKKYHARMSLSSIMENKGFSNFFMQTHRSYIVNKKMITKLKGDMVYLNEIAIPVSRKHKSTVKRMFKK